MRTGDHLHENTQADFNRLLEYKPLHVLDIPDEYQFMDAELIEELKARVLPLL